MFLNREDAAEQLAARFRGRVLTDPVVLAIPRGGVPVGAVLARALNAELDVVLARKLRAPYQPELALGAVAEDGQAFWNPELREIGGVDAAWMDKEIQHQRAEIARRRRLFRAARPAAVLTGRSVIVSDDGIATGATMIAALQTVRAQQPRELIVAVPVASPERLAEVGHYCDEVVCLLAPERFWAIGQFYEDFRQVEDIEVVALLRATIARPPAAAAHA